MELKELDMFKKIFCKHIYKKIAKRKSNYCSDYTTFSDLGDYEDILYECKKCGKQKIETFNTHLHNEWERVNRMNNREIVDYILSNKLTEEDVIKRIYKDEKYISIQYLYNDGFDLWDEDGNINIFSFCDDDKELYTYEIISQEQAQEEIEAKSIKEKIERLERELRNLKESGE